MQDTPDPSGEEPAGEDLADTEDQSHGVESILASASRDHGSESTGHWNDVENHANKSHGLVELYDGLIA